MAKPGKGMTKIGVTLPISQDATIRERAEPMRMSQAAFVGAIVDAWFAAGCPPVTEADRAMLALRDLERKTLPPKTSSAKRSA